MRRALQLEEFSTLSGVGAAEVERYRAAGLLDPDGDGLFDEYDTMRLQYVILLLNRGESLEDIASGADSGTLQMPFFGDLLFNFRDGSITLDQASERLGLTPEQIRALATAIGMPITRAFDEKDLRALEGAKSAMDAGLPWEAIIEASRVFGDAFRRIAGTEERLVHEYILKPDARTDPVERTRAAYGVLETLAPIIEPLLAFVHRQYLLKAFLEDSLQRFGTTPGQRDAAILFADLSGFTAFTQEFGDDQAVGILDRFDGIVRELVLEHRGALVKQMGDEAMCTFDDAVDAVRFAIQLAERAGETPEFPAVRVGINFGSVLYRGGDYVGATVNLAARIVASAAPREILLSEGVAGAAREAGVDVMPLGVRLVRGVSEPIHLYRVARVRGEMRDPVCGAAVRTQDTTRLSWGRVDYPFCSPECLRKFIERPDAYTSAGSGTDVPR